MALIVIPEIYLSKDKWDDFVLFLQTLPIPARRKKQLIVQWTKAVGAVLTRDMVKQVLGLEAEEV